MYNIDVSRNPRRYLTGDLYAIADLVYLVNAVFYMVATLRDDGWFFFMPKVCVSLHEDNDEKRPLSPVNEGDEEGMGEGESSEKKGNDYNGDS